MSNKKPLDCRAAAARCMAAVAKGQSLSQQITLHEQSVKERDRPLYRQLSYGGLRYYPKLAAMARQLLSKPLKDKDNDVFMLLLVGIYQLSETRIPDHAAVSSTVAATRSLNKPWAKGLTNGVLRQWQRRRQEVEKALSAAERCAHPNWLHQALHQSWPEHATAIEDANNQHPPLCLRVNQQHHSVEEYLALLAADNIDAAACQYAKHGVRLSQPVAVDQLPGFFQGWVSVQDEAPQLSADLIQLQPGQRVLDACCAPGGKTCHLLESEPGLAEVVALDIDPQRLTRVVENLQRLSLTAKLITGDASDTDSWWDHQQFDRILLDAPCSATGVIRRNPDIKLHRCANDVQQLALLQAKIIRALWPTLKPGGLLLYATCSIFPEENERIVESFCQDHNDARHRQIEADWGLSRDFGRQLFPQQQGHDGFFYALIEKKP